MAWRPEDKERAGQCSEFEVRCVKLTSIDCICINSLPNQMFDHFLESSRWDDSDKRSNKRFGKKICIIKINTHFIWSPFEKILTSGQT